ncbi:MAG: hypothetical protein NWE93_14895 [Candidatus Bathyarchaeota archaeon]|nr:hypothetical protein [Candidatus Bathyarchaeota archaeon]
MSNQKTPSDSLSGPTKIITIGIAIAIIGAIICNSYAKDTLTNYTGFAMLLIGIAGTILGIFGTLASTFRRKLGQPTCDNHTVGKPRLIFVSVWTIGIGVSYAVLGWLLSNSFEKTSLLNETGFVMMLSGICVLVIGFFGSIMATRQTKLAVVGSSIEVKEDKPGFLFPSMLSLAMGTAFLILGFIVARSYEKGALLNYTGFGVLLVGIAILSLGITGTIVGILRQRWALIMGCANEQEPLAVAGYIWAIGIGSMLLIIGSLVAGSYEKASLMNYAGFGMLLAGTGVFVYGFFETARLSAVGLLNRKKHPNAVPINLASLKAQRSLPKMPKHLWRNMVRSRSVFNLAGVMIAICILFFSLWQLDLIVSGPVWHQNVDGSGWSWSGPGPYANDYFQCFLWQTTVGQAYDTLFMLIFISFIIMFASAFFWPKTTEGKNE